MSETGRGISISGATHALFRGKCAWAGVSMRSQLERMFASMADAEMIELAKRPLLERPPVRHEPRVRYLAAQESEAEINKRVDAAVQRLRDRRARVKAKRDARKLATP